MLAVKKSFFYMTLIAQNFDQNGTRPLAKGKNKMPHTNCSKGQVSSKYVIKVTFVVKPEVPNSGKHSRKSKSPSPFLTWKFCKNDWVCGNTSTEIELLNTWLLDTAIDLGSLMIYFH